jgi:hypothetical protein
MIGLPDSEALVLALDKLATWGNLRSDADTGRVTIEYENHYGRALTRVINSATLIPIAA